MIFHHGRHMQGLASGSRAGVDNAITRLWIQEGGYALTTPVLYFVPTILKRGQMLQARALAQHNCLRTEVRGLRFDAFAS